MSPILTEIAESARQERDYALANLLRTLRRLIGAPNGRGA
jgi:hypothetical protein